MRYGVAFGGISIIIAITLIFAYLLFVVFPIFESAEIKQTKQFSLPADQTGKTIHLAMEEQNEVGLRVTADGQVYFLDTRTGEMRLQHRFTIPKNLTITAIADADPARAVVALALSNGKALLFHHQYNVTFPDNKRLITPEIVYPLGEAPISIDAKGHSLTSLAVQSGEDGLYFAAATDDRRLLLVSYTKQQSLLDDTATFERAEAEIPYPSTPVTHLLIDKDQEELYVASEGGNLTFFGIKDKSQPKLLQVVSAIAGSAELTALRSLAGGISVLIGTSRGELAQWSLVRNENNVEQLVKFREFEKHSAPITKIVPEFNRKGFIALDSSGMLGIYHTTAERTVLRKYVASKTFDVALSPRANSLWLLKDEQDFSHWNLRNAHPEISWHSLWGKVWYENYSKPEFIWQSSSASNDFEPKFSLVPISFGTLKAAFYAMLMAIPLAIMGAIFTAQFMSPGMRQLVKPSIESMGALPTVILGFLAGLWLAPFIEKNLPGIFLLLLMLPPGVLLAAYTWQRLPQKFRYLVPEGWEGALLIPAVLLISWVALAVGTPIEELFFKGDMPQWLSNVMGIDFDQRNSIVVGIAMGFAVIPTIFSIAEDALFAVPKHLIHGSLALGATAWQTLIRVVILTASPGIFSAVMIGLGRAVGETMIVLMATGNTPVMDFSIFQGMRTLSANIAVEMPESEVGSSHYRVLFLAALVLFAFTFLFNTVAELVRQRLRRKYSSL